MQYPNKQNTPPPEEPKKVILPVVAEGTIVKTPRPITRRFFDFVFAESPKAIVGRIGTDILVPRMKAGVEEAFVSFVHGMFWGQGQAPMSTIVKGTVLRGGGVNYNGISTAAQPSALTQARQANEARAPGGYEDLVCPTQGVAERILAQLIDVFNQYRVVSVADLYEMANIKPGPTDGAYGWLSLDSAKITKERDGYVLALPRPTLI